MKLKITVAIVAGSAALLLAAWTSTQAGHWHTIGSYRTGLTARTNAQAHNARLAARALDGKVIQPHSELSFNRAVGSWSADRGYVKAPVSYDGELIPSWGGGVCQTSTTLYNAALLAGMEIIQRHRHHFPARYAPPGQDAAVAQHDIDLRIKNPYDWPLKIIAGVEGEHLVCSILSQRPIGKSISIEREIRQVIAPGEVVRAADGNSGHRWRVVNKGSPGLRVAVYRRTDTAGDSSRELLSEDTYPALNRLVLAGE